MRTLLCLGLIASAILSPAVQPTVRAADDLEKQLVKQAPEILKALQAQGYQNVGILKFRVKKGNDAPSDRVGTLNARLAEKLELALIVKNPPKDEIGIIHNASKVAATISGANHVTPEGRKPLFSKEYPLAWGDKQVTPDVFIVGVAFITPDLKTMQIGLQTFDAKDPATLKPLDKFEVKPDLEDLLESGESFAVRGVFDKGSLQLTEEERKDKATAEAVQNVSTEVKKPIVPDPTPTPTPNTNPTANPSANPPPSPVLPTAGAKTSPGHPLSPDNRNSPVQLEIRYNNIPQPFEFQGGIAFVAEPKENQEVTFVVRRNGPARPRIGVVLKVNGENTLRRQKTPDAECSPWVFEPNLNEFGVVGYQLDGQTAEKFRVLSQAESKAKEIDYGEFVGMISISVFKERDASVQPKPKVDLSEDADDFAILNRSVFPDKTPANLGALKAQLNQLSTRGIIAQGPKIGRAIDTVQFKSDPVPIMTATVRYYNASDLPK